MAADRIEVLLPDLRGGGVERIRLELGREFARVGCDVSFLIMQERGELLPEVSGTFPIVSLEAARIRHALPKLISHLRNTPSTAVLAAMWPLTTIAPVAAQIAGYRGAVVVSEHDILSLEYAGRSWPHGLTLGASTALGYRLATGRVAVSRGAARDMAKLSGVPLESITVINNPVRRLSRPDIAQRATAESLWTGGGRRILTVGNLKEVKNHELLLHALAKMPGGAAQVMIVGQGQNEAVLRALASRLGIERQVIFAGFHADPSAFYDSADLFVLSSNNEGFGNVLVEALSFGLPVVSTDCPSGPAEILENGKWGRLVPVGDAEALARAIEEALVAPVDREALKRRAADFSPEIAARKYLDVLGLA